MEQKDLAKALREVTLINSRRALGIIKEIKFILGKIAKGKGVRMWWISRFFRSTSKRWNLQGRKYSQVSNAIAYFFLSILFFCLFLMGKVIAIFFAALLFFNCSMYHGSLRKAFPIWMLLCSFASAQTISLYLLLFHGTCSAIGECSLKQGLGFYIPPILFILTVSFWWLNPLNWIKSRTKLVLLSCWVLSPLIISAGVHMVDFDGRCIPYVALEYSPISRWEDAASEVIVLDAERTGKFQFIDECGGYANFNNKLSWCLNKFWKKKRGYNCSLIESFFSGDLVTRLFLYLVPWAMFLVSIFFISRNPGPSQKENSA